MAERASLPEHCQFVQRECKLWQMNPGSEGDNLMQTINVGRLSGYLIILSCVMLIAATGRGQSTTQKQSQDQGNEVVRVNTELVQTDVMVFDKRGHFVDGLKPQL